MLGLILCFAAVQLGAGQPLAHAAPAAHSQSLDAKGDSAKSSGKTAGNGSSSTGKSEGLLVAEVVLLLVVGRLLGRRHAAHRPAAP